MWVDFDVRGQHGMDIFIWWSVIMNMNSYFVQKWQFQVKNILMMDLFLTNMQLFTWQDIN